MRNHDQEGRFLPGHDAKLKKALIDAALGGSKRAENKLETLGWTKFLDAKRSKAAVPAKPSARDTAKPRRRGGQPVAERPEGEHTDAETPATGAGDDSAPRRRGRPRKVRADGAENPTAAGETPRSE